MIALVVILPDNYYERYEGREMTHYAQSEEPLSAERIESFRLHPELFIKPDEPEAA